MSWQGYQASGSLYYVSIIPNNDTYEIIIKSLINIEYVSYGFTVSEDGVSEVKECEHKYVHSMFEEDGLHWKKIKKTHSHNNIVNKHNIHDDCISEKVEHIKLLFQWEREKKNLPI